MSMILDIVKFIWEQLNNRTRIEASALMENGRLGLL